jgi:hypothetical protein
MRHIRQCLLWGLLILGGCAPRMDGVNAHAPTSEANGPKGLVFTAPDGFEERPQDHMYYHSGLRASISPAYEPGAVFDKVAAEFTKENLRTNGVSLKEMRTEHIKGRKTLFVKADRIKTKDPRISVTVLFPTSGGCAQLTAIYPADLPSEMQQRIESAILNARYNE